MSIYTKIAQRIFDGKFTGAISGFQTEMEQVLMERINKGFSIEDPTGEYDDQDKLLSASGTIDDYFGGDDKAAEDYYNEIKF